MKVLKRVDTSNWSYKRTCTICESELQVEKGDVKYKYHRGDQRDPDYETWHATCPVCQNEFPVPEKELSKALKVEIKSGKLTSPGITYVDLFEDLFEDKKSAVNK
jgi:hypothetical protein